MERTKKSICISLSNDIIVLLDTKRKLVSKSAFIEKLIRECEE